MRAVRWGMLAAVAVALLASACGGDDDSSADKTPAGGGGTPAATSPAATTTGGGSASPAATQASSQAKIPADACALVTQDEVHKLAATAGNAQKQTPQAVPGVSVVACRWEWPQGVGSLDLRVSTLPPGTTAAILKTSLSADIGKNGKEVKGLGDYAVVTSAINADANVRALVNGMLLELDLNVLGARDQQDQLVELAKAAAGRIK